MKHELTTVIAASILSTLVLLSPLSVRAEPASCQNQLANCLEQEESLFEQMTGVDSTTDMCMSLFKDCLLKR